MAPGAGLSAVCRHVVLFVLPLAILAADDHTYSVVGGGSTALRDYISDAVGNATQDANYAGCYFPFYTIGTAQGILKFLDGTYSYSVGDFPLSAREYAASFRPIVQTPWALSPSGLYYNIPGFSKDWSLQLTSSVAAGILQGTIKAWDDPLLLAINPNLTKLNPPLAKGQKITVVSRTDSNAAAYTFSQWLQASGNTTWKLGLTKTFPVPEGGKGLKGGANLTKAVANTPFSVGISDPASAKKAKLNGAALQNKAGKFVRISKADFTLKSSTNIPPFPTPTADWSNFTIANLDGAATYPALGAAFIVTNVDLTGREDRGAVQKQLFGYMLGPSVQSVASAYQEYPLPPAFLNASIAAINTVRTLSSREFFQPEFYPKLGAPYNQAFTPLTAPLTTQLQNLS